MSTLEDRQLWAGASNVLESNWVPKFGYSAPNNQVYPWMWLWDSCFHSLIWATLGDQRAATEFQSIFTLQQLDGFVPHMGYQLQPAAAVELWGRSGQSFLTQPPMYCHSFRVLSDWGYPVRHLADKVREGVLFLVRHRRNGTGLLEIAHPWEGGTDDSPRWDAWAGTPFDRIAWGVKKRELLQTVVQNETGASLGNSRFKVAPAAFNALAAFNLLELHAVLGEQKLRDEANAIIEAIEKQWDETLGTWIDWSDPIAESGRIRTLEALLPVLVSPNKDRVERVFTALLDDTAYGSAFGPCGVHRMESTFEPTAYWRGAGWPQLTYLFYVAALRRGKREFARQLQRAAARTAVASRFAEYFDPLTGEGLGAIPQCWAGLPCVMSRMEEKILTRET